LELIDISVKNTAMVLVAGVAGMKAAIDMACSGLDSNPEKLSSKIIRMHGLMFRLLFRNC